MKNTFHRITIFFSFFIIHFNILPAQQIQWQKTIGGSGYDDLGSLIQTSDGGFLLGGSSSSNISGDKTENNVDTTLSSGDLWIIKLDSVGNIQWQNTIGGTGRDMVAEIIEISGGGFIIGGNSFSDMSGDKTENGCNPNINYGDIWIVKIDPSGNILWQNTISGNYGDDINSISQTLDGGYICGCSSNSNISCDKTENNSDPIHSVGDYWILKLDSIGNIQWQNTIGGGQWGNEGCSSIIQTTDGGYICGGSSNSGIVGDKTENCIGGDDCWILKLDSIGNIQWQNTIGGTGQDFVSIIKQLHDGSFICGGSSSSGISGDKIEPSFGSHDYWIFKLDSIGNIIWQTTLGGDSIDILRYITTTNDNGFICGGETRSFISGIKSESTFGQGPDFWIIKLDSVGNIQWQNTIGGVNYEFMTSIIPLNDGKSFICGGYSDSGISGDKSDSSYGFYDIWILKLNDHNQSNLITGKAFVDNNSNNIQDSNEIVASYRKIYLNNTNSWVFVQHNGFYGMSIADSGTISVSPNIINYYTPLPATHNATFSGYNQTDSLNDFAYQPNGVFNDLCLTLSPIGRFRSGFNASYLINYGNYGTTNMNGDVIFYPDSNITFVSSSLAPSIITPDSIIWNVGILNPFQTGNIVVTIHVNTGLPIATLIYPTVHIEPLLGDANPTCNYDAWAVYTVGSFDPNEMLVSEDTLTTTQLSTSPFLDYIIRFQNTGNDTAITVKILNPIDTNRLDLNTLEFVASSHPVNMNYIPWERNMEFKFDNILLPDSSINEPMSHGFMRYRIKPKTSLPPNDSITNFAAIYFDKNNPILTNNAITKIVLPNIYVYLPVTGCNSFISPSGNYTWTTSGTYLDTIPASGGLDSIFTIYLTLQKTYSTISPNDCESYFSPSGNYTWTLSGTYLDTIPNIVGCDSIITINLSINKSFRTISPVACESYTSPSGNSTWTTTGTYSDTIPNALGCDSIVTINLKINNHSQSTMSAIACDQYLSPSGNFIWTATGTFIDTITNSTGCDSILTINLTIKNNSFSIINPNACDSYTSPGGQTLANSGTYYDTIPNLSGCDSVITINLNIYNKSYSTLTPTACESYISPSGNYTWYTSGTYLDTIPNIAGCDSILAINLTIKNNSFSIISPNACESYTSPSGNYTLTSSGTYMDTIPNATGCDSVITIDLTIKNKSFSTINPNVCESYLSPSGNNVWTISGTFVDTIPNATGCDSVITINLTIKNKSFSNINPNVCESYLSPSGNYTWTTSGVYFDTIPNATGCDSVITIDLTIKNKSFSTISPNDCESYLSPSGNYTWSTSGTYLDTIPNTAGCDSVITINLTINNVDTSVTVNNPLLISNASGATYQWIYCDSVAIAGANSQSFIASANGSYAVIVSKNGCLDTSLCYDITGVGILENKVTNEILVNPNPANHSITIQCLQQSTINGQLIIFDPFGRVVYYSKEINRNSGKDDIVINISNFVGGLYFVQLDAGKQMFRTKFVKQ